MNIDDNQEATMPDDVPDIPFRLEFERIGREVIGVALLSIWLGCPVTIMPFGDDSGRQSIEQDWGDKIIFDVVDANWDPVVGGNRWVGYRWETVDTSGDLPWTD